MGQRNETNEAFEMPPLDAGADVVPEPETEDFEPDESVPIPPTDEPEATTEQPGEQNHELDGAATPEDDVADPDILGLLKGEDAPAEDPGWKSDPEYQKYQEWLKAQGQAAVPEQEQTPIDTNKLDFDLTQDEYEDIFDSDIGPQAFKSILGKQAEVLQNQSRAMQAAMVSQLNETLNKNWLMQMQNQERMLYLHDAVKDNPELVIPENQKAFSRAMEKAITAHDDPGDQVKNAVDAFNKAMVVAKKVKATGDRVDVRGKQAAPRTTGASPRELHKGTGQKAADVAGLGFLASAINRGGGI